MPEEPGGGNAAFYTNILPLNAEPARPSLVYLPIAVEDTLRRHKKWCSDQLFEHVCVTSALPTPMFPLWSYLSPETVRTRARLHQQGRLRSHAVVFTCALTHDRGGIRECVCVERAFLQSSAHADTALSAIRAMFVTLQIFQLPLKTVYLPRPDPHSLAFRLCAFASPERVMEVTEPRG